MSAAIPAALNMKCEWCKSTHSPRTRQQRFCSGCTWVDLTCARCGESFRRRREEAMRYREAFCSRSCGTKGREKPRGARHHRYNGGLHFNASRGRWMIRCRDGKWVYFYRAVMEAHLGRSLKANEVVHHINRDPSDDRVENLQVLLVGDHARMHALERWAA